MVRENDFYEPFRESSKDDATPEDEDFLDRYIDDDKS
jgi:hypothetical protein